MKGRPDRARLAERRAARATKAAEMARAAEAARDAGEARLAKLEERNKARAQSVASAQTARAQEVEQRRVAMRERVQAKKPRRRRDYSRGFLLAVIALLLLLLLRDCEEAEPEVEAPTLARPSATIMPELPPAPSVPAPDLVTRERPPIPPPPVKVPPWVIGFRMQVSARSPRLARCFEGMERPGRIKWTASVEPISGQVSDQVVETQLRSGDLSSRERACVTEVLSSPDYRISAPDETAPTRISVVLEF